MSSPTITADDKSPLLNISAWLCIVVTALAVIARLASRWAISRKLLVDDLAISSALILSVGFTIAISFATENGLGQNSSDITGSQQSTAQKAILAAGLTYVTALSLTKVSIALFLRYLTAIKSYHTASDILIVIIGAQWIAFVFAQAFECPLPQTYDLTNPKCSNVSLMWILFEVVNCITDLGLTVLPIAIFSGVQLTRRQKLALSACYISRIVVIAASISRIAYIGTSYSSPNYTFELWPNVLCSIVVLAVSIITACIPYMKPFLESLETGQLRNDDLRRLGRTELYAMDRGYGGTEGTGKSRQSITSGRLGLKSLFGASNRNSHAVTRQSEHHAGRQRDQDSLSSETNIIRKTVEVSVNN